MGSGRPVPGELRHLRGATPTLLVIILLTDISFAAEPYSEYSAHAVSVSHRRTRSTG